MWVVVGIINAHSVCEKVYGPFEEEFLANSWIYDMKVKYPQNTIKYHVRELVKEWPSKA